jgi:hypothetical protein
MAVVKMAWVKTPKDFERYLNKDRGTEKIQSAPEGLDSEMGEFIEDTHNIHRSKAKNLALTVMQSWSKEESSLYSPEEFNAIGVELASRLAPGHLAWVVTHTEKNHLHNHIVICTAHTETGKLIKNDRDLLHSLHKINNEVNSEKGLAQNMPRMNSREVNLPPKIRDIVRHGGKSWQYDLLEKADFARASSTSFDEYVGVLNELGVHARVENRNISYFYGENTKGMRGRKLGKLFDKESLMKSFKENDERFATNPQLKNQLLTEKKYHLHERTDQLHPEISAVFQLKSEKSISEKDYSHFTKIDRRSSDKALPKGFGDRNSVLHQEMIKARDKMSILEYCNLNKIKTTVNKEGKTVLQGREFVVLQDREWINEKNNRKGTLIDFVATHDKTDYLRAISKINNNPNLLLLEPYLNMPTRSFQSFYFPKNDRASVQMARSTLQSFLKYNGANPNHAESLLRSKNVLTTNSGRIWLFSLDEKSAMEFYKSPTGNWEHKKHGDQSLSFFEKATKSNKMIFFKNPVDFLLSEHSSQNSRNSSPNIFVGMTPESHQKINEFLVLNPHIKEILIAPSLLKESNDLERSLFKQMKTKFDPFHIEVKELSMTNNAKGKDLDHQLDI